MHLIQRVLLVSLVLAGIVLASPAATKGVAQQPARPLAFDQPLPEMNGKTLNMKVVDIRVAPGAASAPHMHGCAVVVYVISGAMRMQVRGGPENVYRAGQTFFEKPTDIHQVSANASATDSAHFTATFVCDRVGPLTTPAPPSNLSPTESSPRPGNVR